MSRLTPQALKDNELFGIANSQLRGGVKAAHGAEWYDGASGIKCGFGDLSFADLIGLMEKLLPGEIFVVVRDNDIPSVVKTAEQVSLTSLAAACTFIVLPRAIYYHQVDPDADPQSVSLEGIGPIETLTTDRIHAIFCAA